MIYLTDEKPDQTVSKIYFRKLQSARPLFTVSLPCLDNIVNFVGHTAIMNTFKRSIM